MTETEIIKKPRKKRVAKVKEGVAANSAHEISAETCSLPLIGGYSDTGIIYLNIPKDEHGLLDWRKIIPTSFIRINSAYAEKKGIPLAEMDKDAEKVRAGDENCVINMAGFNFLANLRGFSSLSYDVVSSNDDKVSTKCRIELNPFIANGVLFPAQTVEALASASFESCTEEFSKYYEALAENRSFIRAIRRGFNINLVGREEISDEKLKPSEKVAEILSDEEALLVKTPQEHLKMICEKKGRSIEELKKFLLRRGWVEDDLDWEDFGDIAGVNALSMMNLIEAASK